MRKEAERVEYDCITCGTRVQRLKSQARGSKYCSWECRKAPSKPCETCGEDFRVRGIGRRERQRYCSLKCRPGDAALIDGRSSHPQYDRWYSMMYRCTNARCPEWHHYGGRGISVAQEWQDDPFAFYAHLDTLGPCPEGYSLDRIDNDGDYAPGNLRWASGIEQFRNRRTYTVNPTGEGSLRLRRIDSHSWVIGRSG